MNAIWIPESSGTKAATFIRAIAEPPINAPIQVAKIGFPRGTVTPQINGSPIPKKPIGNALAAVFFNFLF